MTRSRLWLLAIAPILIVSVLATQHFVLAQASPSIRSFTSCGDLHAHYVKLAVGGSGQEQYEEEEEEAQADDSLSEGFAESGGGRDEAAAEEEAVAEETASDEGEVSETGTNVQERGVDESDIIKTDGTYFYILRPQSLLIAEISEDGPLSEVGRIYFTELGHRQELLIGDGKAVVVRQLSDIQATLNIDKVVRDRQGDSFVEPTNPFTYSRAQSEVLEIDVSDPTSPSLLRELNLDGRFLSARLVGDDVRIAMQHSSIVPRVDYWQFGGWNRHQDSLTYSQALQDSLKLGQWYPLFGLQDHAENAFSHGYAVECSQAYAPVDRLPTRWRAAPSMAYLLTFDLTDGLGEWGGVAMLGMADNPTVYASQDSLYLAAPTDFRRGTTIHRFDIADPLEPSYFGSGTVTGRLLSQWSLSEHDGYLRVATTDWRKWPRVSSVTVLEAVPDESDESDDDADASNAIGGLMKVGRVTGLGVTESIRAVRFAGDVGYVVTFRQIDPLYVLDLSDPTDPKQVGELKIPGFSRYLHPLSGGLLLGVGRDADPRTGRELGLQATLFDVSDPANPMQVSILPLGDNAFSPVETDHRAFRYNDGTAWIPVGPNDYWLRQSHDGAFFGVAVSAEGLTHESTLRVHGEARRAIPIGDQIHLLSSEEIRTYSLEDDSDQGSLSFALEWDNRWLPVSPE